MIFIFIVVMAPGVTDAMFYYESNVQGFTSTDFGILNVISTGSSIIGVWTYRILFKKASLTCYFFWVTIALSSALLANLLIVRANGNALKVAFG
jgi:BT1 family